MLDYEIMGYTVEFYRKGGCSFVSASFGTEKEAIDFIKECRNKWKEYRLIKIQAAIIDF